MGVFFTASEPVLPAVHTSIMEALRFDPKSGGDIEKEAAQRTLKLDKAVAPKFNGGRFAAALALSAVLLVLAIVTQKYDMSEISKVLMTSFTSYNGLIIGLLGGEAQKPHSG